MKGTRANSRYAKSLADLAAEKGSMDTVYADMLVINSLCKTNKDFELMLQSPIIKTDKKQKIFNDVFSGKISEITQLFIKLLAFKRRESFLSSISESFINLYKDRKNILTALIYTATPLDDDMRRKIVQIVKTTSTSEVELIEKINPKLIGGFTLQVGDKRLDASIAKKIQELSLSFNENRYVKEY